MTLRYRLWLAMPRWVHKLWGHPQQHRVKWLRRFLLWLALGPRTYRYMSDVLAQDPRAPRARLIDIVVRKDGVERRLEADWVRSLARIVHPPTPTRLSPDPPQALKNEESNEGIPDVGVVIDRAPP
jgi:hypothetical protein